MSRQVVLSLVERGWQAAREWSLNDKPPTATVVHLVKGSVHREVRALIRVVPQVALVAVPRKFFWPATLGLFLWHACRGTLQAVLVDNERSHRWLRRWSRWIPTDIIRVF